MWLRPWEACNPNDSGYFAASHPPMHCSNRSIRKLSQHYATVENIIATVLASSMRVPFTSPTYILSKLAFFQSNRVSAIKRLLFYYRHISIFVFRVTVIYA